MVKKYEHGHADAAYRLALVMTCTHSTLRDGVTSCKTLKKSYKSELTQMKISAELSFLIYNPLSIHVIMKIFEIFCLSVSWLIFIHQHQT